MKPQDFDEALFSEFLLIRVERFRHAVGVEGERVAWKELAFANRAIPIFEKP
jgi:hypothetical protein